MHYNSFKPKWSIAAIDYLSENDNFFSVAVYSVVFIWLFNIMLPDTNLLMATLVCMLLVLPVLILLTPLLLFFLQLMFMIELGTRLLLFVASHHNLRLVKISLILLIPFVFHYGVSRAS